MATHARHRDDAVLQRLRDSSTGRGNSGSSSSRSTPRWARLASPGRGPVPPPTIAAAEAPWCGARNGGVSTIGRPAGSVPATEWMRVTSSAASRVQLRQEPGRRRPASSCRFPVGRRTGGCGRRPQRARAPAAPSPARVRPRGQARTAPRGSRSPEGMRGECPSRRGGTRLPRPDGHRHDVDAASGADSAAQMSRVSPALRTPSATAIVPATGRTRPSRESSPTLACSSSDAPGAGASRRERRARSADRSPSLPCEARPARG